MKAPKGSNRRRVPGLFLTGRSWAGTTIAEVAEQVREARAKAGVYVFEGSDGCALYVGRSLYKLAARIGEHASSMMAKSAVRVWALESTCPGVDEVRLIAVLLPSTNRETQACPGNHPRPKVSEMLR